MQIDPKDTTSKTIVNASSVKSRETREILGTACLSRGQHVPTAIACLNSAEPMKATRTLLTGGTGLSVVLSGALMKCHIRGLEQQTFIVLFWKLAIRDQGVTGLVPGLLPGVQTAVCTLCPHVVDPVCVCVPVFSSYRDASRTGIAPTLMASSYLSHLFKPDL